MSDGYTPWWDVLGIPSDSDHATKRRAYARLLKVTNPEDDPKGFMALREAYEAALRWIEYDDWDDDEAAPPEPEAEVEPLAVPEVVAEPEPVVEPVAVASPPVALGALPPAPPPAAEPVPAAPLPDTRHAAEQAELRELIGALEAGLRGPWFKPPSELLFYLTRILPAPAMIELETRDRVEFRLAELLADTLPRSDPLLVRAIEAFGWDREGEHPPAVWRIRARIDEWRLVQDLGSGKHELDAGWAALTRRNEDGWIRRIHALRPGLAAQVRQLFDLADYQTPGIVHSMDEPAAAWWRAHLSKPRFGFVDLTVLAAALLGALIFGASVAGVAGWSGAALIAAAGIAVPLLRMYVIAPWRLRREADYAPLGWVSHGWAAAWGAALLLLIALPSSVVLGAGVTALSAVAALWMAAIVGREPRLGNPLWSIISFGALALVGAAGFIALSGYEQLALSAFAIASAVIAIGGREAVAELLWRVWDKPVLAAAGGVVLMAIAAGVRTLTGVQPLPIVPWGAAAIGGMVLMRAVREVHDGSFAVRLAPLVRWALWAGLVVAAILSAPEVEKAGAPPIAVDSFDPLRRLEQSEPAVAALKFVDPKLYAAMAAIGREAADGRRDYEEAQKAIDGLVNAAYRERLPRAPAVLIAAEMDIRLATMREQQKRDPGSCASAKAAATFTPSDALRKRHYRHALLVAGTPAEAAARMGAGTVVPMRELMLAAADGDVARAQALSAAMTGADATAKCAAQIAALEALTARTDIDIAKTMRPALVERAAKPSAKK